MIEAHPVDTMRHGVYYVVMTSKPAHQGDNVHDAIRAYATGTRDQAKAARLAFARDIKAGPGMALAALAWSPGPIYRIALEQLAARLIADAEANGGDWLTAATAFTGWLEGSLAKPRVGAPAMAAGMHTVVRAAQRSVLHALRRLTSEVPA